MHVNLEHIGHAIARALESLEDQPDVRSLEAHEIDDAARAIVDHMPAGAAAAAAPLLQAAAHKLSGVLYTPGPQETKMAAGKSREDHWDELVKQIEALKTSPEAFNTLVKSIANLKAGE